MLYFGWNICPAELFIFMGIASGITELGFDKNILAIWYIVVGIVLCLIRGIVTEKMFAVMQGRKNKKGGQVHE